jgi:hypothetical protein
MLNLLWAAAVVLCVLWMLGFAIHATFGGLIHLLLVLAVISVLVRVHWPPDRVKRRPQSRTTASVLAHQGARPFFRIVRDGATRVGARSACAASS